MSKIKVVVLTNGFEIVGEMIDEEGQDLIVKNAFRVLGHPNSQGYQLIPIPISVAQKNKPRSIMLEEISISRLHILFAPIEVNDDIEKTYLKMSSGLELVLHS